MKALEWRDSFARRGVSNILYFLVASILILFVVSIATSILFGWFSKSAQGVVGTYTCGQGLIVSVLGGKAGGSWCSSSQRCDDGRGLEKGETAQYIGTWECPGKDDPSDNKYCCIIRKESDKVIRAENIRAAEARKNMLVDRYYLLRKGMPDDTPLTGTVEIGYDDLFSIAIKTTKATCNVHIGPTEMTKKLYQKANCMDKSDLEGIVYIVGPTTMRLLLEDIAEEDQGVNAFYARMRSGIAGGTFTLDFDGDGQTAAIEVKNYQDMCHSKSPVPCASTVVNGEIHGAGGWDGTCTLVNGTGNTCKPTFENIPHTCNPWTSWENCRGEPKGEWLEHRSGFRYMCLETPTDHTQCYSRTEAKCQEDQTDLICRGLCKSGDLCHNLPVDSYYYNGPKIKWIYCLGTEKDLRKGQPCTEIYILGERPFNGDTFPSGYSVPATLIHASQFDIPGSTLS